MVLPTACASSAALAPGLEILPAEDLDQVISHLRQLEKLTPQFANLVNSRTAERASISPSSSPSSCAQKPSKTDPDLAKLINAWPTLPEPLKAGIRAMVEAARSSG